MPAYDVEFDPIVLPGQFVKLLPERTIRKVQGFEPMPLVGPVDFGAIAAGNESGPDNNDVTELEMNQNQIGQFRAQVLSNVEVEVRQTGNQDQRYAAANSVGVLTPVTPPNTNEFYVQASGTPRFLLTNPNTHDLSKALVSFTGFKFNLTTKIFDEGDVDAQPVTFPVEKIEVSAQAPSQQSQTGATRPRNRTVESNRGGR